ncbi:MAG: methyl-accepting chemotaxis protein [Puniceicoccaceae bacterium]
MKILPQRISTKIWSIVAVFVVSLMGIMAQSFLVKGDLQQQLQRFSHNSNIANVEGRTLVAQIDAQLKAYEDAVVSGESDLIVGASRSAGESQDSLNGLAAITSASLKTRIQRFSNQLERFTRQASEVYPKFMSEDEMDDSVFEQAGELAREKTEIREEAVAITVAVSDELSSQMATLVKELGSTKTFDLVLGFAVTVVVILMVSFVIRIAINRPFADFIQKVKILSEGDLTVRFSDQRKDELSQLGNYLNHYVDGLLQSIRQISDHSALLKSLADETHQSAEEIQLNTNSMSTQADSVSNAGNELSSEMSTIAGNAKEMTSSTSSVAAAIEEMSAAISEVAMQCNQQSQIVLEANQKADGASKLMHELGEAAKEIQKIVEIINAIAAQTNLLALNATIEAASAGDAGKGFAVVANEVKELARQSSDSSGRIRSQIQNITQKTEASLKAVDEISEIMSRVSEYSGTIATSVEQQSSTNREISSTMQTVTGFTEEVSSTVTVSSESANVVAESIRGVNASIDRFKSVADTTLDRSGRLTKLSEHLLQSIAAFKTQ